jgi:hypothetical protein
MPVDERTRDFRPALEFRMLLLRAGIRLAYSVQRGF